VKLRKQPKQWQCMLTAYAMCLDVEADVLISEIGHDGSEIIWPQLREPLSRRGFHVQEMNLSCLRRGFAPIWWDDPMMSQSCQEAPILSKDYPLAELIRKSPLGVVFNGNHAWAWDGSLMYNPSGNCESPLSTEIYLQNARSFCQLIRISA
jgi:hypothetical protein